jgi:hypothetical protein
MRREDRLYGLGVPPDGVVVSRLDGGSFGNSGLL